MSSRPHTREAKATGRNPATHVVAFQFPAFRPYSRTGEAAAVDHALTQEDLEPLIHAIRGQRVVLDADLARLYGVGTKALNQAVKRI
ncbi:MAG TPA: ORF6N domain-containing protein, partial [Burkholderiales bacterium]